MATNTKTHQNFAMKVIFLLLKIEQISKLLKTWKLIEKEKIKREDLIESLKKEISILMMIDHPNIVKLIEVLASKTKIYLVLEYIEGGELWNKISFFFWFLQKFMKIFRGKRKNWGGTSTQNFQTNYKSIGILQKQKHRTSRPQTWKYFIG